MDAQHAVLSWISRLSVRRALLRSVDLRGNLLLPGCRFHAGQPGSRGESGEGRSHDRAALRVGGTRKSNLEQPRVVLTILPTRLRAQVRALCGPRRFVRAPAAWQTLRRAPAPRLRFAGARAARRPEPRQ